MLSKGIVDDTSNTCHRWVETSYVIHHITGNEDPKVLEHLEDSKVNPKRANVGDGVWRSIELNPENGTKVQSQVVVGEDDGENQKIWVEHDESSQTYNPAKEFEFWHGDHAFVAARICEYVSSNYRFEEKGEFGFGVSEPTNEFLNNMKSLETKAQDIERLLPELSKLSEATLFSNANETYQSLSEKKREELNQKWNDLKDYMTKVFVDNNPDFFQSVLYHKTEVRTIKVKKDTKRNKNDKDFELHREYKVKDILLQKILKCLLKSIY